jgi:hypothetical protein
VDGLSLAPARANEARPPRFWGRVIPVLGDDKYGAWDEGVSWISWGFIMYRGLEAYNYKLIESYCNCGDSHTSDLCQMFGYDGTELQCGLISSENPIQQKCGPLSM